MSRNRLIMDIQNRSISQFADTTVSELTIPSTVKRIKTNAFHRNYELVTLKCDGVSQLEFIENAAFYECKKLTNIFEFLSIKTIGEYSFFRTNLSNELKLGERLTSISIHAFRDCINLKSIKFISKTISLGIDDCAFLNCSSVESLVFETTASIDLGDNVFKGLTKLKSVVLYHTELLILYLIVSHHAL